MNVVEAPDTEAPSFSPSMLMSEAPTSAPTTAPPTSIFTLAAEKGNYNILLGAADSTGILDQLGQISALGPLSKRI